LVVIRTAARFAFSQLLAAAKDHVIQYMPALMSSLVAHFETSELGDFVNFMSHLTHKLDQKMFEVMDQLIVPLNSHISTVLSQPATDPETNTLHLETKKTYFTFLNTIMHSLSGIFISDRNKPHLESILDFALQAAQDLDDLASAKAAINFLQRCVDAWGGNGVAAPAVNGNGIAHHTHVVGFERFIYERVVPLVFQIPSHPSCNPKDGQTLVMLYELADLLHSVRKVRGQEALDFLVGVYLPANNCPQETAISLATKLRDLDRKAFRKYFVDFVKASRQSAP